MSRENCNPFACEATPSCTTQPHSVLEPKLLCQCSERDPYALNPNVTLPCYVSDMDEPAHLPPDELRSLDACWRAANYLSVGQIYLYANPLLTEPLKLEHIKP